MDIRPICGRVLVLAEIVYMPASAKRFRSLGLPPLAAISVSKASSPIPLSAWPGASSEARTEKRFTRVSAGICRLGANRGVAFFNLPCGRFDDYSGPCGSAQNSLNMAPCCQHKISQSRSDLKRVKGSM
jgi:hypothetical protein